MAIRRTACYLGVAILLGLPQMLIGQSVPNRRPIPYPVVPSREFQLAIENGTRTETGEPGPAYWQQSTDYELRATLDPEENFPDTDRTKNVWTRDWLRFSTVVIGCRTAL